MDTDFLPPHLKKYVVEQDYEKYTPIDQAVWRYILRQLRSFLGKHAHECYLEGLAKTGINVERIPRIDEINEKLVHFGWRAMPVSGFIPPAAFMELQSLGVLPIASDMRSLDHLLYTPAPDIVHEAAGHAPILIHPEFSAYLQQYAQIAKKAIISKEDLDLYEAIRDLSDTKENPHSTPTEIAASEFHLQKVSSSITNISEATELSRMNWWTAEYGLIGDLKNPKIFGAGLLSSVGESKWCLSDKVKKIPLTIECLNTTYDITEPQPQLFVAKDFQDLAAVLEQMAEKMAFREGGKSGLEKIITAQTVNTVELNSGIQISGKLIEAIYDSQGQPAYLRFEGPTQLCFDDSELDGHDKSYHAHGFGTPIGELVSLPGKCLSDFTETELEQQQIITDRQITLDYTSGVKITGKVISISDIDGKNIILSLSEASAKLGERVLFAPEWGTFDLALGCKVTSVFGGPADREAYGETTDFVAKRVPKINYSAAVLKVHKLYSDLRTIRESQHASNDLTSVLTHFYDLQKQIAPDDWLLYLEALEIMIQHRLENSHSETLKKELDRLSTKDPKTKDLIQDGLLLAGIK